MPQSHADIALDITNFSTLLWEDVEKNEGAGATEFYTEDGVFDSKFVCFRGRDEIRAWFAWRKDRVRTARHLLTNYFFDFSDWLSQEEVEVRAIMTHYGADGKGVLQIGPPIGIYDFRMRVRKGGLHGWSIILLENNPVFMADNHVANSFPGATN